MNICLTVMKSIRVFAPLLPKWHEPFMNVKKVSVQNAANILKSVKCKPTILLRGAKGAEQYRKTVKCSVLIVTGKRVIYNCILLSVIKQPRERKRINRLRS